LIEQVSGVELYQVGELDTWKEVARWLARLHDRFTGAPLIAHVLQYDEQFLSLWFERARAFGRAVGIRGYELVVDRLIRLPRTLVHGELYASNVLIAGDRVCVVDWETAGAGPGVIDLATLTTGWQEAQAAELAAAYREALRDPPDPAQFAVDLDFARLHLAVRWLGWSPEWSPPPEHARDWHADALELQARLGLCGETT
jgi:thiamine kinase-like enzyme